MTDHPMNSEWLNEYSPDYALIRQMHPCPECGAEYCIDGIRPGPAIIGINKKVYLPICLACWHKGRKGRTDTLALSHWNSGASKQGLREHRLKAGLSIEKLSELSTVSTGSISEYERGIHIPSQATKERLANVLRISPYDI